MLSLQYFNNRLKKTHIDKIIANYNIKYTTMKKEIDNKINIMIKTVTQDINSFLTNMEEIAEEKQKLKSLEINQNELETLKEQLKDKIHEQTKLRREIELLRIENKNLKFSNDNTNNTISSARKKLNTFSPLHRENNTYQALNTISNFQISNINTPSKKQKDVKTLILKTDKKEKKENKDTRLFKSPETTQNSKHKKKMSDFNLNDNKKKQAQFKKKDKNKTQKNILSYSAFEVKNELGKKNPLCNSTRNLVNKNKKNTDILLNKNKKNGFSKKNEKKQGEKMLNKTIFNFAKNKDITKDLAKSEYIINKDKTKDNEEYSSDKENITNNDDNNESKSKITTEDNEEEQTIIDEEINEMNDIEEEILSLMDQIKQFKEENNNLT